MELTPFTIYLIFTAPNLGVIAGVLAFLFSIATIVILFVRFVALDDIDIVRPLKWFGGLAIAGWVICALVPFTKTLVAMYGIPAAIEAGRNVASSAIGQKAYSAVDKLLDEYLAEKKK